MAVVEHGREAAFVERRSKLSIRRRASVRRRSARMVSRLGVLGLFDAAALVVSRALLAPVAAGAITIRFLPSPSGAGPLADPGSPASLIFWVVMPVALATVGAYGRHRREHLTLRLVAGSMLAALVAAVPLAAVVGWWRAVVLSGTVALTVALVLRVFRVLAELVLQRVWPRDWQASPAVIVGSPTSEIAGAVTARGGDYRLAGHYSPTSKDRGNGALLAGQVAALIEQAEAEAVVLTEAVPERQLQVLMETALDSGCRMLSPPVAFDSGDLRPRMVWHNDRPLFEYASPALQAPALLIKRLTDVVGATVLLAVLFPVMLLIAIGIKLDSRGPIFFAQHRAGLGGKKFRMLKFRTMRLGADEEKENLSHLNQSGDVRLFKIPLDPRVTRFGRFLRRWSLDELPQFWNVLRGEMSLVGPRPFFESDFAAYEDHHFRRLDTKPGITGLWQVGGRSDVIKFEDVVYLDRQYIEQWSFWLDVSILLRTMPSVIRRTGAY